MRLDLLVVFSFTLLPHEPGIMWHVVASVARFTRKNVYSPIRLTRGDGVKQVLADSPQLPATRHPTCLKDSL